MDLNVMTSIVEWFELYGEFFTPVALGIFIVGISIGIIQLFEDRMLRTALLIPVGTVLLVMGFFTTIFGRELYFNLGVEVFTALIALVLVGMASQLESWTSMLLVTVLVALGLMFFIDINNLQSSITTNFATGILGAYLTGYLIRKEWSWSPQAREKRLSQALRQARKEQEKQAAQMGDYFMLISGTDEGMIKQRIDFLKEHDVEIVNKSETEQDEETKLFYQLVTAKIITVVKNPDTVFLSNQEARLQILGYPDSTKKVFKQIGEVLNLREQKRIEAPDEAMFHVEVKADVPAKMYSAFLEEEIYKLARKWQYGEDEVLQAATDDLLEWAKSLGFVKK